MSTIFIPLFLVSLVCLVVGIVRPSTFRFSSGKKAMLVFGPVALALFVLVAMTAPPRPATTDTQAAQTTTAPESPAYKLALYDASYAPDTTTVAKYQSELDALKALCTEDEATLASEIWASWKDLESNKVTDETNLSLMAHIAQSVPSSAAPTDCRGVMAAYLVMREPAK